MWKNFKKLVLLTAALSLLPPAGSPLRAATPAPAETVVAGHSTFAIDLYRHLGQSEENLLFSPLSISLALAMTHGGARGDTARQMAAVLHFAPDPKTLHQGNKVLHDLLVADEDAGLQLANSLWPDRHLKLRDSFLNLMRSNYGSEIQALDFQGDPQGARQTINSWVEHNTGGLIPELLQPSDMSSLTALALVNALVYRGTWETAFDPQATRPGTFLLADGSTIQTELMSTRGEFGSYRGQDFRVLQLPFAGRSRSLLLAVPDRTDGLPQIERDLSTSEIERWVAGLRATNLNLLMPRFDQEERLDLKAILKDMGMPLPFSPGADFSGLCGADNLWIDKVIHQARLEVHEEGAKAAAATVVTMKRESAEPMVLVNRPFLYLIRDDATGSILFMGRVLDPSALAG